MDFYEESIRLNDIRNYEHLNMYIFYLVALNSFNALSQMFYVLSGLYKK